ncbi:sigma-70 family RNA polymerase sigma factor [Maricaulaceae bacterium EIL42A08]|nr:sigma-70 family RNA polymerase sigma factor [Maricaulaceae bacterium EIL42A08]
MDQRQPSPRALDAYQAALAMDGDRDAFDRLYRRWHVRLLRHAHRLTGHSEDARDVMQEVAMALVKNIHRLRDPDQFGPWAYTIVRNRSASFIQRVVRDRDLKRAAASEAQIEVEQTGEGRSDDLISLIATLPLADREVLSAYYVDGMSVAEIAACLALAPGTVKSRLHTARTHLKAAYDTQEGVTHE